MPSRKHIILATTILVFTNVLCAQSGPRERDVWYEFVHGDVRYGFQHVRVVRQTDGNFRYTVESKILIDLFGAQKQEISTRSQYVVTPELRPVSLQIDTTDLSGKSRTVGEMQGDDLVLSTLRAGETSEQRITCGANHKTVLTVCLEDGLAALKPSDERATFREISDEVWQADDIVVNRQPNDAGAGAVWRVGSGEELGARTLTFDGRGVLESMVMQSPQLHLRRCTEQQAEKLVYRNMGGRELLVFPLDKPIRAPSRLRKIEVKLTWTDIPFDEFELEDARQKVTMKSEDGGHCTAVLTLSPPAKAADARTIPIEDPDLAPYLAETTFIKPKHPKIVAAAREAIAGEKNAAAAVRALSTWVSGHINGELVARTLSGPEVLACKSGKCTEYSTLFASMARSIGVPTRLALGERMVAGKWMGHMWNEAYVGRWVTVDASTDEVDQSFTLLKFIHSDTVMGTQPLRWKLTKSLAIAIESFDLVPSGLEGKYKTGVAGSTYTNTDHACRIVASGEGWTLKDKSTTEAVTVQFKRVGSDGVFIHFVAFVVPVGTPPKVLIDNRLKMWHGNYPKLTMIKNEACKVAGAAGHISRFSGVTKGKAGLTNFTTEVVWISGENGYLLNMIALEPAHKKHLPHFEKLLAGFEFLE